MSFMNILKKFAVLALTLSLLSPLSICFAKQICNGDLDFDGDTDGSDLVLQITNGSAELDDFASGFGLTGCQEIVITTPQPGDNLEAGSSFSIQWESIDGIDAVDIFFSCTYEESPDPISGCPVFPVSIVRSTPNDGLFEWKPVPFLNLAYLSDLCWIEIKDSSNTDRFDNSDDFALVASTSAPLTQLYLYHLNIILSYDDLGDGYKDSDGDGLYDTVEVYLGTDADHKDSDRDFLNDKYEVFGSSTPNQNEPIPNVDDDSLIAALDDDDDGIVGLDGYGHDEDIDGLANFLEAYGFVYDSQTNEKFLPCDWDPNKDCYRTNYLQASTDGDHIWDQMEVSGTAIDLSITYPGRHPLVPAFPNFVMRVTKHDVTLNAEITEVDGTAHEAGKNWSVEEYEERSHTEEAHWEVSAEVSYSPGALGGSVSASYGGSVSDTYTTGTTTSNGGDQMDAIEWSLATCSNPTSAAIVDLDLRARNIGTCPAKLKAFSFNLYFGPELVGTYDRTLASDGLIMVPSYLHDFTLEDIELTYNELRLLETGAPVSIETFGFDYDVMAYRDGQWTSLDNSEYNKTIIDSISARLFLDLGNGETTEHLVYAGSNPPVEYEPVVTLYDALKWMANATEDQNGDPLVSFWQSDGTLGAPASMIGWYFSLDQDTFESIESDLDDPNFTFFDTVLRPGAVIVAKAPPVEPTPAIRWGVLSPRDEKVTAYVEDYFSSNPAKIEVSFVNKYGAEHSMSWNNDESYYECPCPTNSDGTVYLKDGSERIVARNGVTDNINGSEYRTELPVADMRYVPSFENLYPKRAWLDTLGRELDIAVDGYYAYVAAEENGLLIIQHNYHAGPTTIVSTISGFYAYAVAVSGNYAYVTNANELQVIDISNPLIPVKKGKSIIIGGASVDVCVAGNLAYVAASGSGLKIFDVSDPDNPQEIGSYDTPGSARGVFVDGDYAYVADDYVTNSSGVLNVINISNPATPQPAGLAQTGFISGVSVDDGLACVGNNNTFSVVDVNDPTAPITHGPFPLNFGQFNNVTVINKNAFIATSSGLIVMDITNPSTPTLKGDWGGGRGFFGGGVEVIGSNAYLVCSETGLVVVDISDAADPKVPGALEAPCSGPADPDCLGYGNDVFIDGAFAYVVGSGRLLVADISNPSAPELRGSCEMPSVWTEGTPPYGVYVHGEYAYVADGDRGLQLIDISNPDLPEFKSNIITPGTAYDVHVGVHVIGNVEYETVYVADGNRGLRAFTIIENPNNPPTLTLAYDVETPGTARSVSISGDYAYVADGDEGLQMINISNTAAPQLVGYFQPSGNGDTVDVSVKGKYVFISYSDGVEGQLVVIDVSSPSTPPGAPVDLPMVGQFKMLNPLHNEYVDAGKLFISGDYVFWALGDEGVQIIDISNPADPTRRKSFTTPGAAKSVFVDNDKVYVADGPLDLFVGEFK